MIKFPTTILNGPFVPVDVKVYYENKQPYLEYTGECRDYDGNVIKVYFPKIGLNISAIERNVEMSYFDMQVEFFATLDQKNGVCFEIIEREMNQKQIEKELGYKIKIIDE